MGQMQLMVNVNRQQGPLGELVRSLVLDSMLAMWMRGERLSSCLWIRGDCAWEKMVSECTDLSLFRYSTSHPKPF